MRLSALSTRPYCSRIHHLSCDTTLYKATLLSCAAPLLLSLIAQPGRLQKEAHFMLIHRALVAQQLQTLQPSLRSFVTTTHARCTGLSMVQTRSSAKRASVATHAHAAEQKALDFEGIKNIRDLSVAFHGIRQGLVYRTAAPVNATPHDIKLLYDDLGIKDLIDLRSTDEVHMKGQQGSAFDGLSYCRYRRDPAVNRVVPDATTYVHGGDRSDILRTHIAVIEKQRYYWSILSRMKKRQVLQIAATALVDKPASRRIAIEEVNRGGLEALYRILLEDSSQELIAVLRHIKASVASGRPVLFFCKAGKDRTGLVAALLLSVLEASEEEILQDYVISDKYHMVALAGLEENSQVTGLDRSKFERAPREAMHHALQFIKEQYGGAQQYLVQAGFGLAEQEELRQLLLQDDTYDPGAGSETSRSRL